MASVEDVEVFIPDHSHIITLPVRSLPSSIIRKMTVCPSDFERLAIFISPVELREKGVTPRPRPLTPGQIRLPVVTSNCRAIRTLRNFLHSGEVSLHCSAENSCSSLSRKKNSIILFNSNIFLIQPKASRSDWLHQTRTSAPLEYEVPPTNTLVKKNDDITERSKDGAGAAEDHGKCAETLQETGEKQEALMKDVSTKAPKMKLEKRKLASEQGRANQMTSAAANQKSSSDQITMSKSSGGQADRRKRLSALQSSSETTAHQTLVNSEVKGQISDSEIRHVNADSPEITKKKEAKAESYVKVQSRRGQRSRCQSAVQPVNVLDNNDSRNSKQEDADADAVQESLLKTCERIRCSINSRVTSMGSVVKSKIVQSHDVTMETSSGRDDPIAIDEPNRLVSGEIVNLHHHHDYVNIKEDKVMFSYGHQKDDVATRVKQGNGDERNINQVGGTSAKRQKREVELIHVSEEECLNDVRIIKVDDDDVKEMTVQMNEASCAGVASGRELDCRISELPETRHISCSDGLDATDADTDVAIEVQRIKAEDVSAQRNLHEHEDVLMKVLSRSFEDEHLWSGSEVLAMKPRPDDQVLRKSSREPNGYDSEGCVESDVWEDLNKKASEMKKASDEEGSGSSDEKQQNISGNCFESYDGCEPGDGVTPTVASEHLVFTAQQSGATNQSADRGEASVFPNPTPPPVIHEMDYVVLSREENINLIREKLREIEEKLNNLNKP